jgi:hypothetical protein
MSSASMTFAPRGVRRGQGANRSGRGVAGILVLLLSGLRRLERAMSGSELVVRRRSYFLSRSRSKVSQRFCIQVML